MNPVLIHTILTNQYKPQLDIDSTRMFLRNRLKELLAQDGIAFGGVSHIASTAIVELMGLAGYDFDILDTEHGTYDVDTAGELIRAAHGVGITPIVRVLQNDPGL